MIGKSDQLTSIDRLYPLSMNGYCRYGSHVTNIWSYTMFMIVGTLILLIIVMALLPMGFKCSHCGKRRSLLVRLMSLDREICDDCIDVTNKEIREKTFD